MGIFIEPKETMKRQPPTLLEAADIRAACFAAHLQENAMNTKQTTTETPAQCLQRLVDLYGPLFDADDHINGADAVEHLGVFITEARAILAQSGKRPAVVPFIDQLVLTEAHKAVAVAAVAVRRLASAKNPLLAHGAIPMIETITELDNQLLTLLVICVEEPDDE